MLVDVVSIIVPLRSMCFIAQFGVITVEIRWCDHIPFKLLFSGWNSNSISISLLLCSISTHTLNMLDPLCIIKWKYLQSIINCFNLTSAYDNLFLLKDSWINASYLICMFIENDNNWLRISRTKLLMVSDAACWLLMIYTLCSDDKCLFSHRPTVSSLTVCHSPAAITSLPRKYNNFTFCCTGIQMDYVLHMQPHHLQAR